MSKEILIRHFETPTDIYICGGCFYEVDPTFSITDDEYSITIFDGYKELQIVTYGSVYIFTTQELLMNSSHMADDYHCDIQFIESFEGDIKLTLPRDCDSNFVESFNKTEYIIDQIESGESAQYGIEDVCISLTPSSKHYLFNGPVSIKAFYNLFNEDN